MSDSLYPEVIDHVPDIVINDRLDILLLELPPRYFPMMPNGLAHVARIMERMGVSFQVLDLNILLYHDYHLNRHFNGDAPIQTPSGPLTDSPWAPGGIDKRCVDPPFLDYLAGKYAPIIDQIAQKKPRIVGLSIHGHNRRNAKAFVQALRAKLPKVIILVGGYDCVYPYIGPRIFSEYDYMVIGEAEGVLEDLVPKLLAGKRPTDVPGVVSKHDSRDRVFTPAALYTDLDAIAFPQYEWLDLIYYQTHDRLHNIPIVTSRGCRWGRCRFCAEAFPFRKRSPKSVVDEIEFFAARGWHTFHINDSDCNGDPDNLHDICSEILRRGLTVHFAGQLRVDKRNTLEYMRHLRAAGFSHLRFGVDGWTDKLLHLQRKGYNMPLVFENLKNCHDAGITTAVNVIIGIPGETEEDMDELAANFAIAREHVDIVESINLLILSGGSEYYLHPEKYNIVFKKDKEEIYREFPYWIPHDLWYCYEPFADIATRQARLVKLVGMLQERNVPMADFAASIAKQRLDEREGLHLNIHQTMEDEKPMGEEQTVAEQDEQTGILRRLANGIRGLFPKAGH
ncbi:MAG: radical SAM protein [Thermodesulfobacteriota bacterium]